MPVHSTGGEWYRLKDNGVVTRERSYSYSYSSRGLYHRWGIKEDRVTTFLHSFLSSAF